MCLKSSSSGTIEHLCSSGADCAVLAGCQTGISNMFGQVWHSGQNNNMTLLEAYEIELTFKCDEETFVSRFSALKKCLWWKVSVSS